MLEAGRARLPEQSENQTTILWPHGGAGTALPVIELHEDPLPPYLYGPYLQDVPK